MASQLTSQYKSGQERFRVDGKRTGVTLLDYWRWSGSNLLDNTQRGLLAEYLVANAVGETALPRAEWGAYDITMASGARISVKSSAYEQNWYQRKPSPIRFGVGPKRYEWNPITGESRVHNPPRRLGDIWVFCVLGTPEQWQSRTTEGPVDPLELQNWTFYVASTRRLNNNLPRLQKMIALRPLSRIADGPLPFDDFSKTINETYERVKDYDPAKSQ